MLQLKIHAKKILHSLEEVRCKNGQLANQTSMVAGPSTNGVAELDLCVGYQ